MSNSELVQQLRLLTGAGSDSKLAGSLQCTRSHIDKYKNYVVTNDTDTLLLSAILNAEEGDNIKDLVFNVLLNADNNVKQRMINLALTT